MKKTILCVLLISFFITTSALAIEAYSTPVCFLSQQANYEVVDKDVQSPKNDLLPTMTFALSVVACALSVYNFYEARKRKAYEKKCLVECRFLTVRTKQQKIVSITFRFCLTNISSETVALRKIYFSHPAINKGKKLLIDQIAETYFEFAQEDEFKSIYKARKSVSAKNSGEVLPYVLKPNTKYEGHASIGIGDKGIEHVDLLGGNPTTNMIVTFLFNHPQKYVIPITYKEVYKMTDRNAEN